VKANFEDTKEVIRSHKLKDRQHNGQKKKGQKGSFGSIKLVIIKVSVEKEGK
jgi:hypothetical protein